MKKHLLVFLSIGVVAAAQAVYDHNLGLNVTVDSATIPDPTYTLSWWGKAENHYLVEVTPDLVAGWTFLPDYNRGGSGAPMGIQYQEDSTRFFFRVWQFDPSNIGTLADSDGDSLPDKWELYHFGNLSANGSGHADGDGISNADEYAGGTNPNANENYTVTMFEPTDEAWTALGGDRIIDLDETAYFKIIVTPQLPTVKAALVRPGFGEITAGNRTIELTAVNTQLINTTPGQSELRVTAAPAMSMMSLLAIPGANDSDLAREKSSYDTGEDNSGADSNLTDSDAFMTNFTFDGSSSVTSRGRASFKLGDFPIGPDSVRHAGWTYVSFEFGDAAENHPIPSQADFFYYSGHGLHSTGRLIIGQNPDTPGLPTLGPADVKWNEDLDVVIIAGCSILDINNYENHSRPGYTPPAGWKPGDEWSKTGPRIFLGYNWSAPLDNQGGTQAAAQIVNSWIQNREAYTDVGAWQIANNNSFGRNACAIDATAGVGNRNYHYYRPSGFIFVTWVWETVHESSW